MLISPSLGLTRPAGAGSEQPPVLKVTAWSDKPRYQVNEPIHLGIKIVNTSKDEAEMDNAILFRTNVLVRVTDQNGQPVDYPDSHLRIDVIPKDGLDSCLVFIKLKPGYSW